MPLNTFSQKLARTTPAEWLVTSYDGTTVIASNGTTGESFSGSMATFQAMFASAAVDTGVSLHLGPVASQEEMLALNAIEGNFCFRTDTNTIWILKQTPATTLSNWQDTEVADTSGVTETAALSGSYIMRGGGTAYVSALSMRISASEYVIQGTKYAAPEQTVTAATADGSFDRIDVVVANTNGEYAIITGTASASPVRPEIDPSTQVELTFFLVPAGTTTINIVTTNIYTDGAEYATSKSGTPITLQSTSDPDTGTYCISGIAATANNYFQFQAPATLDPNNFDNLVFRLKPTAAWPSTRKIAVTLRSGNNQKGTTVMVGAGTFGFDPALLQYQQVVIPMSAFSAGGVLFNQIRFTVIGTGATIGFRADNFVFQSGIAPTNTPEAIRWRGDYNADAFYLVNDAVYYAGYQYVASQPGIGNTPALGSEYWQRSSGQRSWYHMPIFVAGKMTNEMVIYRGAFLENVSIPANFAGSASNIAADKVSTGSVTVVFKKNGTQFGTLTINAAGTSGTYSTSGVAVSFTKFTDILSIHGPAVADATLENLWMGLKGDV